MPANASLPAVEVLLAQAIAQLNAGQRSDAQALCAQAMAQHAPHPGVLQLVALLQLHSGKAEQALALAQASLALRPQHPPTEGLAAEACFALAVQRQDAHDLPGAEQALRSLLRLQPPPEAQMKALVNLGIVLQERGALAEALQAYGQAYRLQPDCLGRIAHALAAAPQGQLWLDLDGLRRALQRA